MKISSAALTMRLTWPELENTRVKWESWLAKNGHTVDVITGMPYYPRREISSDYKKRWWHTEYIDGVKVHRCPLYVPRKISSVKRMVHEISFVLSTLPHLVREIIQPKIRCSYKRVATFSSGCGASFVCQIWDARRSLPIVQDLQVDVTKAVAHDQQPAFTKYLVCHGKDDSEEKFGCFNDQQRSIKENKTEE